MFSVHLQHMIRAVHNAQNTLNTQVDTKILEKLPHAQSSLHQGQTPLSLIKSVFPWELQDLPLSSHILLKLTQDKNTFLNHLKHFQNDVRSLQLFSKDTVMVGMSATKGGGFDYIRLARHVSCPSNVHSANLARSSFEHQAKVLDEKLTQVRQASHQWKGQILKTWTARTLTNNGHPFTKTRSVQAPTAQDALNADGWAHWSQEPHYLIVRDIVDEHERVCAHTPVYDDIQY